MPGAPVHVRAFFAPKAQPQPEPQPEPQPQTMPFQDVQERDWFYEAVYYVYSHGLMSGTSATTFQPHSATTRGMIVTILYRRENRPVVSHMAPFQDVSPRAYYAEAISWAAENGIVCGYSAGRFGPDDRITRQQLAAILYRYTGYRKGDISVRGDLSQFRDADQIQPYAREPLSWANGVGLITGVSRGMLRPEGVARRAQVAAILQRLSQFETQP